MTGFRRGAMFAPIAALLCGLTLAACGSSDETESTSDTSAATQSASTEAATTASTTAAETGGSVDPSKPKVVIALNTLKIPAVDLLSAYEAGANAAAKEINASGGFGGREVVIESCNTMYQPATVASCARKTIAKNPVANIGCDPGWGQAGLPIYAKAEVPSIVCINTKEDYTDPWSFGMTQGQEGDQRAVARFLCTRDDVKKVVFFTQDIPFQHESAPNTIGKPLEECGKSAEYVYYPITGADLSPYVTKAAQAKPDFVITLGGGALAVQIFKLFTQAGIKPDQMFASANAMAYESVLKPAGATMEGVYAPVEVVSWDDTSNPGVAQYLKAMEGSGVDPKDSNPETAYMYVQTIYKAAQEVGFDDFDGKALAEYLNTANDVEVPTSRMILNPGPEGYPQVKQPYTQIVQWKGGKLNVVTEGTEDGWILAF